MFSRAKRFDVNKPHAPAPGQYAPSLDAIAIKGPASFPKADRFTRDPSPPRGLAGPPMAEEFSRPSATPLVRRATVRSHTPMTPGRHSALRESSSLGDLVNVTNTEEVKRLLAEQKKLLDKLKSKDEELATVKAELKDLSDKEAKAQFEKENMATDLELLRNTVSIFQQQKNEVAGNFLTAVSFHEAVELENGQLHGMLAKLREEFDLLSGDKAKLEQEYQTCQEELESKAQAFEDIAGLKDQVQKLEQEKSDLSLECTNLKLRLSKVTEQLSNEIQRSTTLAAHCASADLRVAALEGITHEQCGKLQSSSDELHQQCEANRKLQQTIEGLDMQIQATRDEHGRAIADYEDKLTDVQGSVLQQQLDLHASEENTAKVQALVEEHLATTKELEEQLAAQCSAHTAYKADIELQQATHAEQVMELEQQLHSRMAEIAAYKSCMQTTEDELVNAKRNLEQTKNDSEGWMLKCDECSRQLDQLAGDKAVLEQRVHEMQHSSKQTKLDLEEQLAIANGEVERICVELASLRSEASDAEASHLQQLKEAENKSQRVSQELSRRLIEAEKRLAQSEGDHEQTCQSLEEQVSTLTERLESIKAKEEESDEAERWRLAYEKLQEQCAPFKSQLELFSAEKQLLESQSTLAKTEMEELNRRYGELLGHQNQKQKIRHVMKLKEDNLAMKQELMKLRDQCDRQRKVIRQHDEKSRVSSVMASGRKVLASSTRGNVGLSSHRASKDDTSGTPFNEMKENGMPSLRL